MPKKASLPCVGDLRTHRSVRATALATACVAALATACVTNPATGGSMLSLVSESQEIQMGREAATQIDATIGLYDDPALQAYVFGVGGRLAASSERPHLPWTFKIVDDPQVNAFALPGGFLYVTRGILAYFNSEAELASVLGHEIGHVTARHTVQQISRQQLFGLGLGVGSIFVDEIRQFGDVIGSGLGLLFLKYSRDDERQADDLGLRYMRRESYAVEAMVDMFTLLEQKAEVEGASALPTWASTHPSPADRRERTLAAIAESPSAPDAVFGRDRYLERIDGMIFSNPRDGYFEGSLFLHPELEFQIKFPVGWRTQNTRSSVFGASPNQEAVIQLSLAEGRSPERALRDFLAGEGIRGGDVSRTTINGLAAAAAEFGASTQQRTLRGLAVFLSHGGRLYRLLGYASAGQFRSFESTIERSFGTFDRLTDPRVLAVQPARVKVVTVDRTMPIGEVGRRHTASVDAATLALLNGLAPGESVPAGASVKVVIGGELPRR